MILSFRWREERRESEIVLDLQERERSGCEGERGAGAREREERIRWTLKEVGIRYSRGLEK